MHQQDLTPIGGSIALSALCALLPLATLLVLIGGLKWRAQSAAVAALGVAVVVAVAGYGMPVAQAADSGLFGAALGVLVVLWITFNAIWIYNLTVDSGHFAVLRRSFSRISPDQRVQAIVIAFAFGALLEALAGGGAPVAVCAVMLIALGFDPLKAAAVCLLANTAPVAFGGMGNPITVLNQVTGLPADDMAAMAGRQVPFLALLVPFALALLVDGRRGVREVWPVALVGGGSFAVAQFAVSNFGPYKLTDIGASLVSAAAIVLLLRWWEPARARRAVGGNGNGRPAIAGAAVHDKTHERAVEHPEGDSRRDIWLAYIPYLFVIVIFSLAQVTVIKDALAHGTWTFDWPGLDIRDESGKAVDTVYELNYLGATGTLLFAAGLLTMAALKISPKRGAQLYGGTLRQFGWAIVTILCVFALAYVMNLSGQTLTLGRWLAGSGSLFAFLAPMVGWFGVAITGTDAGSNALFGALHVQAAKDGGISAILLCASNSAGGVMAKMISAQSLAIATAAVGLVGQEGTIFRRIFTWSVGLLLILCVLVYLQSTDLLGWMVPS
jgi:lactate permease